MGRIFILGSGFSVQAGAPLSRSVLGSLFKPDRSAPHVLELKSYIDRFLFPGRPDWVNESDFEEVLSRLDLIRHFQPYPNIDYNQVSYYEDLLIGEFTKLLDPAHLSSQHCSYTLFRKMLKPFDTVISFNYDLVLESLLAATGVEYTYCLQSQITESNNEMRLLKLHGSINLYYCPRCSQIAYISPQVSRHLHGREPDFEPGATDDSLTCRHCSTTGEVVILRHFIIAPTLFKSFSLPVLRKLWFTALQALAGASQVFIIGYSLPEADILSHQLFDFAWRMSAQNQAVHIINGPRAAADRFHNIYGPKLKNEKMYFENWVKQL